MRSIFALIILAACVAPAAAQTPWQACKSIPGSLERLRCYDALDADPAAPLLRPARKPAAPGVVRSASRFVPPPGRGYVLLGVGFGF